MMVVACGCVNLASTSLLNEELLWHYHPILIIRAKLLNYPLRLIGTQNVNRGATSYIWVYAKVWPMRRGRHLRMIDMGEDHGWWKYEEQNPCVKVISLTPVQKPYHAWSFQCACTEYIHAMPDQLFVMIDWNHSCLVITCIDYMAQWLIGAPAFQF